VNQQGQQQRKSQAPAFTAHERTRSLAVACGTGRSHRLRIRGGRPRGAGPRGTRPCSAVAARLLGHRRRRGAGRPPTLRARRPDRATRHDLAEAPRTRSRTACGRLSTPPSITSP
jgi:hypothetical protein